jgi:methyl-accepting chemotaxis protein
VDTSGRGVEEIRRSSESTMQRIEELSRKSRQIEQVLGIITEVADETNLLSLNAAILAAQAGERGAAFAVVADQIRNLAHRTQDSIRHIEGIIREVQENIRETNLRMSQSLEAVRQGETYGREAVEQLSLIEQAVTESVEQAREIAAAAEQQHGTAGEMVSISGEVNKDIHSILSHLQQSTKEMGGIRSLVQQVSVLSDSVRTSARTNHQSALDVSILMGSFVNQMEEIDSLVEGERNDIKALDQAMGPVGESAEATNESLETIHKIVTELVHHADNLQDEVERHLPLKTDDEEKGPGEGEPAALESGMVPA